MLPRWGVVRRWRLKELSQRLMRSLMRLLMRLLLRWLLPFLSALQPFLCETAVLVKIGEPQLLQLVRLEVILGHPQEDMRRGVPHLLR